jgi:uncharacterized protein YbjT (DUF2867 family)
MKSMLGQADASVSYERVNKETAIAVATVSSFHKSIKKFLFVSAADIFPLTFSNYTKTKREAEAELHGFGFEKVIILRPGFVYSDERPFTLPLAGTFSVINQIYEPVSSAFTVLKKFPMPAPLHVETVAEAAVNAIESEVNGILEVSQIKNFA